MILNGFLRGAHDPEIVANIDNKAYAGVATDLKNFIGTKRGALSKRAPFVMQRGIDSQDAYFIPYIYDQDQVYLLMFDANPTTGKARFKEINYFNGTLTDATVGTEESIVQPTFTSNSQSGFVCSQSKTVQSKQAYQRFNESQPMTLAEANGYWAQIKFPYQFVLSELTITNRKAWSYINSVSHPIVQYKYNRIDFIVQGSNNGTTWETITPDESSSAQPATGKITTTRTYSSANPYQYFRILVTDTTQGNTDSNECNFGGIKLSGLLMGEELYIDTPYTMEQVKELHWANENQRMVFFHPDVTPREIRQNLQELQVTGLNFADSTATNYVGNPTFGCFYQERLCLGGFTSANRQFNMSQSNPNNKTNFNFTLPTGTPVATSAMQLVIRRAKYPLREVLSGRNVLYLQCVDGLATVASGGDEVPLTPTQTTADLRNFTPFSDIPAVHQEELAFLVGSDYKTVYAMDYDYNVMRVRTVPVNEHCLSYFDSGIAQMITMKGQLPYIVFRLNNGKILVANAYRVERGFEFHLFPLEIADGVATCIGSLMNNRTGFDTLFALISHSNGTTTLESLESTIEQYTAQKGRNYFLENVMLDSQTSLSTATKTDYTVVYKGAQSSSGRVLFQTPETNLYAWNNTKEGRVYTLTATGNLNNNQIFDASGQPITKYYNNLVYMCEIDIQTGLTDTITIRAAKHETETGMYAWSDDPSSSLNVTYHTNTKTPTTSTTLYRKFGSDYTAVNNRSIYSVTSSAINIGPVTGVYYWQNSNNPGIFNYGYTKTATPSVGDMVGFGNPDMQYFLFPITAINGSTITVTANGTQYQLTRYATGDNTQQLISYPRNTALDDITIITTYDDITFNRSNANDITISASTPTLPDNEIKFIFSGQNGTKEIKCKNCMYEGTNIWADVSEIPPLNSASLGYAIPSRTWPLGLYTGLECVVFDGDDVVNQESQDANGNITFSRPIYGGTAGLMYTARGQFENVADANVAAYNKVITNIAASITYGTGIKLGTESQLEKVGYTNYGFSNWQDYVLADESLKNIPLADTPRKDKKIVIECDYPFPANITFVVYDIKATGVR